MTHLTDAQIEAVMLANGFSKKLQPDGTWALNPYVFDAARALLALTEAKGDLCSEGVLHNQPWAWLCGSVGEVWADVAYPHPSVRAAALYPWVDPSRQGESPLAYHLRFHDEIRVTLEEDEARAAQEAGWTQTPLAAISLGGSLDERMIRALCTGGFTQEDAYRLAGAANRAETEIPVWQVRADADQPWMECANHEVYGYLQDATFTVRQLTIEDVREGQTIAEDPHA